MVSLTPMSISASLSTSLNRLGLHRAPVAIAFLSEPPSGLPRIDRAQPAGCGYWERASEGQAFFTTADDHMNCPVGAFTHGVELPAATSAELQSLIGTMIELKYLKAEEIPAIPHRTEPMRVAAYAPLASASFAPDVVVFRGTAKQIMLLSEAARAAGAYDKADVMGRPACAMLPQSMTAGGSVASLGCIGNRVYTGLGDDEMYLTVPGSAVSAVLGQLGTILNANAELETFHRARAQKLG
jgi:uncharacterized protein (DUF169 family)